ncbi:MAG: type VI secretion system tube protein Hcp [Rubrivivax sp.]
MAVDMFLKIETIDGETVDKQMKDSKAIDVLAWSWGVSQSGTTHMGGGGGAGKASFQDISVTKYIDSASHALLLSCATGEHFTKAVLTVRKAGTTQQPYVTVTMEEVIVSSVSTGGSGGEDRLTENISLNFAKIKFEYFYQDDKGVVSKTPKAMTYDIAANTKEG